MLVLSDNIHDTKEFVAKGYEFIGTGKYKNHELYVFKKPDVGGDGKDEERCLKHLKKRSYDASSLREGEEG